MENVNKQIRISIRTVSALPGVEFYPIYQAKVQVGRKIVLVGAATEQDRATLIGKAITKRRQN